MRLILNLWWSLFWRFLTLIALMSVAVSSMLDRLLFRAEDVEFIFWRPTASWWTIAVLIWLVAAAAPQLLRSIVWGDRLGLSMTEWQAVGRTLSLYFVVLGALNLVFWKLVSTGAWVSFKVFAPLPLLVIALGFACVFLRGLNRAP